MNDRQKVLETIAYHLWEDASKPEGRDMDFWLAAERSYKQTHGRKPWHMYEVLDVRAKITGFNIRRLTPADAALAFSVQLRCYPNDVCDSLDTYRKTLSLYPQWHFGAFVGDELVGYMICKPWAGTEYVIENNQDGPLPMEKWEYLWLCDICILEPWRGKGLAGQFLHIADTTAKELRLPFLKGIAVCGAEKVWARYGFKAVKPVPYGPTTGWWIERPVDLYPLVVDPIDALTKEEREQILRAGWVELPPYSEE